MEAITNFTVFLADGDGDVKGTKRHRKQMKAMIPEIVDRRKQENRSDQATSFAKATVRGCGEQISYRDGNPG